MNNFHKENMNNFHKENMNNFHKENMNNEFNLYHFCPDHMLSGIRKQGLTKGQLIVKMPPNPKFMSGCQWLTTNPDFGQSWNKHSSLPYDRTANRLDIKIPDRPARYLYKWTEKGKKLAGNKVYQILSEFGDPENWYIFKGIVKPEWIVGAISKTIIVDQNGMHY